MRPCCGSCAATPSSGSRGGDARGGLAADDEAAALASALGDTLTLIDALRWRDCAYQQLGRHDEAGRDARRMDALARATGAGYYVGRAHISFGWEAMRAGDYWRSLCHYLAADETLRVRGAPGECCLPLLCAVLIAQRLPGPDREPPYRGPGETVSAVPAIEQATLGPAGVSLRWTAADRLPELTPGAGLIARVTALSGGDTIGTSEAFLVAH